MPYGKKSRISGKKKKGMSLSNSIRTLLGKEALPEGKTKDIGFAGSKKRKKFKK